jgi:polar amino acid transport system substrate-binding protein
MEKINIKNEVKECIKLLSFQFRKANASIKEDLSDYICFADRNHLHQIIINVLINALQACDNNYARITVKSEISSGCYILMISDNGKGIPNEVQDKIFDPFFTTKRGGTGLGLSVVYSLCKKNNIDLEIKSKDNEGTTIILKFKRCL